MGAAGEVGVGGDGSSREYGGGGVGGVVGVVGRDSSVGVFAIASCPGQGQATGVGILGSVGGCGGHCECSESWQG